MRRYGNILVIVGVLLSCMSLAPQVVLASNSAPPPALMISEVQTGIVGNSSGEFVELYNPGNTNLDVSGWRLDFINAANNPTAFDIDTIATNRKLAALSGSITPKGHALFVSPNYAINGVDVDGTFISTVSNALIAGGGYIRITDTLGNIVDLLSWGTAPQVGSWWRQSPAMTTGNSLQRVLPDDATYTTGLTYYTPSAATTPEGGGLIPPASDPPVAEDPPTTPVCEGAMLSEILPNAAGSDTGHEFIEIYNPTTAPVNLKGCSLRLGDAGKTFALPDEQLEANTYRAFYDSETGITLPNATGDVVWLLSTSNEEGVRYANALDNDQAWALIGGQWQPTYQPTPNTANELLNKTVDPPAASTLVACKSGQERNPATNRCRQIVSIATVACKPGQERNPATNRCRTIATNLNSRVACKPGQQRNPQTNRCRSVLGATTTLKPCPAGQQRNSATNRCRKISSAKDGQLAKVQDVGQKVHLSDPRWVLAGVALIAACGYALYEWRQETMRLLRNVRNMKSRFRHKKPQD